LYGNQGTLPINENADIFAMNPYAFSKRLAEEACEFYVNCFNISVVVLRVFNVYGPGQREPFLIPTIVRQVLSASSSVYVKNLYTKRDYIYVDDLISLALKVFQLDGFHVFNAGSGLSYSVLDLIQQIERILCRRIEITSSEEYRINEIVETKADISKAFGKVGWKPYWNIGDGLTKVIQSAKLNNLN
jgi:nucleoside-diphosphate-sugar epimerase